MDKNHGSHSGGVLLLGSQAWRLREAAGACSTMLGATQVSTVEQLENVLRTLRPLTVVTFGFNVRVPSRMLERATFINVHTGYLPWNKGPAPHIWAILEERPFGVSIHRMDDGLDTGPLYKRKLVEVDWREHSLQSLYDKMNEEAQSLFQECWPEIVSGRLQPTAQPSGGSKHTLRDQQPFQSLLDDNLDAPLPRLLDQIKPLVTHPN